MRRRTPRTGTFVDPVTSAGRHLKQLRSDARQLAQWCVATGFGPDVYNNLTLREQEAFLHAAAKRPRLF